MESEEFLCEEGIDEYPKSTIIIGNLIMLMWIALGTVACYFFNHTVAWIFLGVALLLVYVVLRGLVCTNCYYHDKWCSAGWGKLTALLFKQGNIENFNNSIGVKLAPAIYGLLTLVPLVLGTISAVQHFSAVKPVVLTALLLMGFYSGTINRKKACAKCRMRRYCRGSAVKEPESL